MDNSVMEVQSHKIENLEEVIKKYIDTENKVVDTRITRLTAPGENYGSTMLKVDLVLQRKSGETEPLNIVAKLIPENEFFQMLFDIEVFFKMESAFYEIIIPTLEEFQREQGIKEVTDFYPKYYGSRLNINGSDHIDENAVILLENLKMSGFENLNPCIGCNFQATKFILKDLAKFHAVPLALKLLQPHTFENKLKKYMTRCNTDDSNFDASSNEMLLGIIEENMDCIPLLPKIKKAIDLHKDDRTSSREPFATLSHKDMWVNNFMVKLEDGNVVKNKFIDFQDFSYESPVRDLLFFLFTGVQIDVLKENVDYFLKFYHEHFVKSLEDLRCPTKEFSYEKYMDEIEHFGIFEIFHILFLFIIVELGKNDGWSKNADGSPSFSFSKDNVSIDIKERIWWSVQEFEKRKWLGE